MFAEALEGMVEVLAFDRALEDFAASVGNRSALDVEAVALTENKKLCRRY